MYVAISWAKNEFQFLCELGWFLHGQSHKYNNYVNYVTGSAIINHVSAKTDIHFIGLLITHDAPRQNHEHVHSVNINQHTYKHTDTYVAT